MSSSKGRSTLLALAIVLVALLGASFLYFKVREPGNLSNGTQSPVSSTTPVTYTVERTENGFSLPLFPVKAGDTVTFVNKGTTTMRVASDPHPTHGDLPSFDQKFVGDSYEYTFTEPGLWKYHNHFDPTEKGTVFVQ